MLHSYIVLLRKQKNANAIKETSSQEDTYEL